MDSTHGQLTYCSNIHPGESWEEHFNQLQQHVPLIKKQVSPDRSFGIGLRLSNTASIELQNQEALSSFMQWLKKNDCYVFTMNGFPYGSFHHTIVKDKVHTPDWTTQERVDYTIRLAAILSHLLPGEMEGGISTSPLTYRHWHTTENLDNIFKTTTTHLLEVVIHLIEIKKKTGKTIHIDIEPEPDGLLESGIEFLNWYDEYLLPRGILLLNERLGWTEEKSTAAIKEHIQLCYDICHFAVGYEDHQQVTALLRQKNIRIGKIQISAALKGNMAANVEERNPVINAFGQFNETTYLHQVVALQKNGQKKRYPDIPEALQEAKDPLTTEWRSHFHVPLFIENYGVLQSTQQDIVTVLEIHKQQSMTKHLEIETYTWEVLPDDLKLPITDSIVREMQWVISLLQ
ncbi:MAG TPA: metabolite traffic protein EboE [Chitinophagaceae bacterium]|nr:metabolite traffic protein EboE [Chitinophagaceae bacterium]